MSQDPANDARLKREDDRRQQSFREQAHKYYREANKSSTTGSNTYGLGGGFDFGQTSGKSGSFGSTYHSGSGSNFGSHSTAEVSSGGSIGSTISGGASASVGYGLVGLIKTLFLIAALYGAYDRISNEKTIAESAAKTGLIAYDLSDALGNKIKSIDPESPFISIVNGLRWAVGLGISADVYVGAGTGNGVVWVVRQAAHFIQSLRGAASEAAHNP